MIDETHPNPVQYQQDTGRTHVVNCPHCTLRTALAPFCGECGTHMASSTPTVWDQDAMSSVYSQAAATSSSGRTPAAAKRQAVIDSFRGPETYADSYVERGSPGFIANAVAAGELVKQCQKDLEDAETAVRMALPVGVPGRNLDEAVAHAEQQSSLRASTPALQRERALLGAAVTEWKLATEALRRARQDHDRAEDVYNRVLEESRRAISYGR